MPKANVGAFTLQAEQSDDSIFSKLGGLPRLTAFVDGFYDLMAKDPDMKKFFANRNLPHLKARTVDFLGGLWGGEAYRGPDLFLAHTGLGLTMKTFDLMMVCVKKQVNIMGVEKTVAAKMVKDIEDMKEPLIDPSGKLAKAQNAKNLALGDPFDDEANRRAYAENQRKEAERKKRFADFQKQRRAAEAAAKAEAAQAKAKSPKKEVSKSKAKEAKKEEASSPSPSNTTAGEEPAVAVAEESEYEWMEEVIEDHPVYQSVIVSL
eukprot:TRINITY_DN16423_c0_g1_i2.p1 TRINITY_DN16423_c0_g1~~TRINITY_DN16423_c0_g1_i2.p1  ORF type:complete len:263 (-),score=83.31 TRINITY_DN16423_c0_g1_i2:197-985(-)